MSQKADQIAMRAYGYYKCDKSQQKVPYVYTWWDFCDVQERIEQAFQLYQLWNWAATFENIEKSCDVKYPHSQTHGRLRKAFSARMKPAWIGLEASLGTHVKKSRNVWNKIDY